MREEDGRRRRKADTELKTKTSHVNVGKTCISRSIDPYSHIMPYYCYPHDI